MLGLGLHSIQKYKLYNHLLDLDSIAYKLYNHCLVAWMGNVGLGIICVYNTHSLEQIIHNASSNRWKKNITVSTDKRFDLWECLLNGIEIGRVRGQEFQTNAYQWFSKFRLLIVQKETYHMHWGVPWHQQHDEFVCCPSQARWVDLEKVNKVESTIL